MPIKINVLTHQSYLGRGFFDLYPLIKWREALKENGYIFEYFHYHKSKEIFKADVILIHHRYYEQILKGNYSPHNYKASNLDFIIDFIVSAQDHKCKVLVFEGGDSGGTRQSIILQHVNLLVKKQLFKDKSLYLVKEKEHRVQIWLPDAIPEIPKFKSIPPVRKEDLVKIQMGWNIGLCDYRSFPKYIKKYYPFNSFTIPHWLFNRVNYISPLKPRPFLFSYRGSNTGASERYSHNRKLMLNELEQNKDKLDSSFFLGGKVPYKQYIKEIRSSKIGLSPFGWGEICFRDFEVMISGSVLVKPDISHLVTYPNFFEENKTYIPTLWNYEDLVDKLIDVANHHQDFIPIAESAQNRFKLHYEDASLFTSHFSKIISQL